MGTQATGQQMAKAQHNVSTLVSVQTLRGNTGHAVALASVELAVKAHNGTLGKGVAQHEVVSITALPNNVKGMQWQLALLATLARKHGATMVRLSVHNGNVALCGPKAAIAATQAAMVPAYNLYQTMATAAYNPAAHGNRVGYTNGFLCGCPAGLQVASKVQTELAYGIGFLYPFSMPGSGTAYAAGYAAAHKAATTPIATRVAKVATTKAPSTKRTNQTANLVANLTAEGHAQPATSAPVATTAD